MFTLSMLNLESYHILLICFADDVSVRLPCVRINLLALLLCLFACGLLWHTTSFWTGHSTINLIRWVRLHT